VQIFKDLAPQLKPLVERSVESPSSSLLASTRANQPANTRRAQE